MTNISVFGLGYVGTVSAACLANEGHRVIGVELNPRKVDMIRQGKAPIIERGIAELVEKNVASGNLEATTDAEQAILSTDLSFICVGTPSQPNGNLDLNYVRHVSAQIGKALKNKTGFHVVVWRSTMLPGSMREVVIPILEEYSSKRAGVDFGTCYNPEFLREGTAVLDYYQPPKTVIGQTDSQSGDMVAELYAGLDAPMIRADLEIAEMVKYADNAWHALKVCFANEVGNVCKALNIDGRCVMDIFCRDTNLNISPYYLIPGFAFGGSCLPKDLRALIYKGRSLDLNLPILNAILPSNQCQVERGLKMILARGNKKVGILGFSFKAGTDDLRESPLVEIIERLVGKGYDVRVYDRNVNLGNLMGTNREYILNHIPHISRLMVETVEEVLQHANTIVIGNKADEFKHVTQRLKKDQVIVDLVGITDQKSQKDMYDGICW